MADILKLRAHHLLCLRFFEGYGYNDDFSNNVRCIIDRINDDGSLRILLMTGCDDICRACPHNIDDLCRYAKSVSEKDASVAELLGLPSEGDMPAKDLMALAAEKVRGLSDIRDVCGECSMSSICNRHLILNGGQSVYLDD